MPHLWYTYDHNVPCEARLAFPLRASRLRVSPLLCQNISRQVAKPAKKRCRDLQRKRIIVSKAPLSNARARNKNNFLPPSQYCASAQTKARQCLRRSIPRMSPTHHTIVPCTNFMPIHATQLPRKIRDSNYFRENGKRVRGNSPPIRPDGRHKARRTIFMAARSQPVYIAGGRPCRHLPVNP